MKTDVLQCEQRDPYIFLVRAAALAAEEACEDVYARLSHQGESRRTQLYSSVSGHTHVQGLPLALREKLRPKPLTTI